MLYYSLLSSHQTILYCSSMILIEIDILYTNTQYYTKYLQVSTTEEHCPSMKLRDLQKGHGCPFSPTVQTAKKVGMVIQCEECGKWRCLYAGKKLNKKMRDELEVEMETILYSCGRFMCEPILTPIHT